MTYMNKKGVALTTTMLLLIAIGLNVGFLTGIFGGSSIGDFFNNVFSPDAETTATLENSRMVGYQQQQLQNNTAYANTLLYPLEEEQFRISVGMVLVHWDNILNAIDNRTYQSLENGSSIDRSYFVTIDGNTTAIDPMNHPNCFNESDLSGYMCVFPFTIGDSLAPEGLAYEVSVSSSSTNHDRLIDVVFIAPREGARTTFESIVDSVWEQVQFTFAIWKQFLTYVFYIVSILLGVISLFAIGFIMRMIFVFIRGNKRKRGRR